MSISRVSFNPSQINPYSANLMNIGNPGLHKIAGTENNPTAGIEKTQNIPKEDTIVAKLDSLKVKVNTPIALSSSQNQESPTAYEAAKKFLQGNLHSIFELV